MAWSFVVVVYLNLMNLKTGYSTYKFGQSLNVNALTLVC